jgi:hypothetical protein
LKHTASKRFWQCLDALPADTQALAHRSYAQLKADPSHPSLHFKSVGNGRFYGVRIGHFYRALGVPVTGGVHWFWIGTQSEYDKLLGSDLGGLAPAQFRRCCRYQMTSVGLRAR